MTKNLKMTKDITNNDSYIISNNALMEDSKITQQDLPLLTFGSIALHEEDIEDLIALVRVLKNMPDDHPLSQLKQEMHTHKAFNRLESHKA